MAASEAQSGPNGIGRLSYKSDQVDREAADASSLQEIIASPSMFGSRNYPSKRQLVKLGETFGVREPKDILERIGDAASSVCAEFSPLLRDLDAENIRKYILNRRDKFLAPR